MKRLTLLISLLAVTAIAPAATAKTPLPAGQTQFEGTVVSIDRDARTFRLRDSERGTKTIRVTSRTRWERVRFSTLRAGARNIEATVKRVDGQWRAVEVEVSGGGGARDGDDD